MYILEFFIMICQIIALISASYYFVVAVFGLRHIANHCNVGLEKFHKFAVVVAAHNEQGVIAELVRSLMAMRYPRCHYDVFVVADNCCDSTAKEAIIAGANVVVRTDDDKKSKGYALAYAFDHILALDTSYDFIAVIDADNVVCSDFLCEMNTQANNGYKAIQGCIDSKNPFDNWLTLSYSLWYWIGNRLFQLARQNLNIGCKLCGTGFCIATDLICKMSWDATCLAEDSEFTLKLALCDVKVAYAHTAVVYDEKPSAMSCSFKQRKRWIQGNRQVNARLVKPLLAKAIKERRAEPCHVVLGFWAAFVVFISLICTTVTYLLAVLSKILHVHILGVKLWSGTIGFSFLSLFLLCGVVMLIVSLAKDKKLTKHVIAGSLGFIVYYASWIPVSIIGMLAKNNSEWYHTPHGSNVESR